MLDSLACVIALGVGLGEQLVRLDLLFLVTSLFAKLQKLFTHVYSAVELTLSLVNHTDLLVALSLNVPILGRLGHSKTLLKELEGHVELVVLQVLIRDQLVNTDQVF